MVADQAAARHVERQPHLAAAGRAHVLHDALAAAHLLHDHAGIRLVHIDQHVLERLFARPLLALSGDHAGAADGQLEAFAPHGLDQHAQLQLAAARHLERFRFRAFGDADGDVALRLAQQPVPDLAGCDLLAFTAAQRTVVHPEGHGQRRRVDRGGVQRSEELGRAHRVRHRRVRQPGDGDDVAGLHLVHLHPDQPAVAHQLGQTPGLDRAPVGAQHLHRHVEPRPALFHAAGQHPAQKVVVVQDGGHHGERRLRVEPCGRNMAQHEVEQGRQVLARAVQRLVRPALAAGRVEHGKVELLVVRAQGREQVEHLRVDLVRAGVLPVHLVDHHDGLEALGQRLAEHELGLRQHALRRVHQDDGAVHHVEDALDLAAEIRVARGVHDVDAAVAPDHAGALGEDGDAALALQVVAVQRALGHELVFPERARLPQQLVHQRGLAVVDVGDDGDVADVHGNLRGAEWCAAHIGDRR